MQFSFCWNVLKIIPFVGFDSLSKLIANHEYSISRLGQLPQHYSPLGTYKHHYINCT